MEHEKAASNSFATLLNEAVTAKYTCKEDSECPICSNPDETPAYSMFMEY